MMCVFVFLCVYVCARMCVCVCVCLYAKCGRCLWRSEKGVRSPGAAVTDGCESPNMGDAAKVRPFAGAVLLMFEPPLQQVQVMSKTRKEAQAGKG